MRTLIVYYSLTGNVQWTVQTIADALGADTLRLVPKKSYPDKGFRKFIWGGKSAVMGEKPALELYSFEGDAYDLIVWATPVWASTFTPPLRTFIADNRAALAGKRHAVVLCFSGGGADKAMDKLQKALDIEAWQASLVLTDPKDNPKEQDGKAIEAFCRQLQQ